MSDETKMPDEVWISHRSRRAYAGGIKESAKGVRFTRYTKATPPPDAVREAVGRLERDIDTFGDNDHNTVEATMSDLRLILDHFKEQCDD